MIDRGYPLRQLTSVNGNLIGAAVLIFAIGVAHSYLGERHILVRLFRRPDLPHLFGSDTFTRHTLRFAWHLTTVAWWGIAALLFISARPGTGVLTLSQVGAVITATAVASAIVAFVGARGRHLAWLGFLVIALLTWLGTH